MSAVPPVSPRAVVPPAGPQTVQPDGVPPQGVPPQGVPPGGVRQAPPTAVAPQEDQYENVMGKVAGSALTGALFFGAGCAMAFCPFLVPFILVAGCFAAADFLADLAGFSPVKMVSGRSIGGWIASRFSSRPSEPEGPQGVNLRRAPQPQRRPPVEVEPLAPPQRRDEPGDPAQAIS